MVNIRKLKAKLVEKDISIIELANILGIDKSTVYIQIHILFHTLNYTNT